MGATRREFVIGFDGGAGDDIAAIAVLCGGKIERISIADLNEQSARERAAIQDILRAAAPPSKSIKAPEADPPTQDIPLQTAALEPDQQERPAPASHLLPDCVHLRSAGLPGATLQLKAERAAARLSQRFSVHQAWWRFLSLVFGDSNVTEAGAAAKRPGGGFHRDLPEGDA